MAERFELFRLSLLPRPQPDMFEGPEPTREEYLRKVLGEEHKWERYGVAYHYVPAPNESSPEALIGRIGRSVTMEENRPPEEGLAESVHAGWKAAVIIVDPRHHEDGQKAAVEVDRQVASPMSLLRGLFDAINTANPRSPYAVEFQPIVNAESFWQFAEKNRGEITSLTFEFVVPNMFGTSDSISDELRDFRNKERAQRVNLTLKNPDGLDTDTQRTKEAVDYAVKGGGTIKAKTRKGRRFTSTESVETTTIQKEDEKVESTLSLAARLARRILGRE